MKRWPSGSSDGNVRLAVIESGYVSRNVSATKRQAAAHAPSVREARALMRLHDTQDRDGTIRHVSVVAHDRRPLLMLAASVVGWALLTAARPLLHAGDGLAAVYFTNSEWNGPPALSVADARPSTATMRARWNGVPPERF